jgi:hypothetical protein
VLGESVPGHRLPVFFSGRNPGLSALDARLLARGRLRSNGGFAGSNYQRCLEPLGEKLG